MLISYKVALYLVVQMWYRLVITKYEQIEDNYSVKVESSMILVNAEILESNIILIPLKQDENLSSSFKEADFF